MLRLTACLLFKRRRNATNKTNMKLLNFLRKKKKRTQVFSGCSYFDTNANDEELKQMINSSISVFQNNPDLDYNQIIDITRWRN